ncbi:TolC family protein [Variovorax sp. M-6]|uniref:TolC family protein n=1 Tax=Variovorax sp. M-6 TaxID=3233041 RepID=UPI003F9BF12E
MILLPLCLSAEAMAQASSPTAPRVLEWSSFADDGPVISAPKIPAAVPKPPAPAPMPAQEKTWSETAPVRTPVAGSSQRKAQEKETAQAGEKTATALGELERQGGSARDFLERMVAKALALSPDVREASAKWQASEFDIAEVKGQRWPQLQVGVASPSATFGSGTNDSARNAIGNVQLTTPVYDWGRLSRTIDSRTEASKAVHEQLLQVRQQVAFDTVNAVIELRRGRDAMALSKAYVDRMTELVEMLSEIVKTDRGRASELTQARGRRLQAMASLDLVAAKLREVEISLVKLVGEEVTLPPNLQWGSGVVDVQEALSAAPEHPALRQARAEAKAADLYAQSVRASRLPQLNWVVSKTTQEDSLGKSQPWATGLSIQWNAFQGGSASAAERAAFERATAGEEKALAATRDLEYRLRTSAQQRDAALSRAVEYTELIKDSDRVRTIFFEQWYHLGKRTLLDVLIAENDHYNNQIAQVTSRFDGEAADLRIRADAAILLPWLFGAADGGGGKSP